MHWTLNNIGKAMGENNHSDINLLTWTVRLALVCTRSRQNRCFNVWWIPTDPWSMWPYYYYYHSTALHPGLPWWAGTRRNIHPLTYPDHHPIFISFFHLLWFIASSLFNLCAWQSFCTTSLQVLFDLPLGLEPSTSYSIRFFTQSASSFRSTCPYHYTLFCCSTKII